MVTVKQLFNHLNNIMPFETQEKWDNSGLLLNMDKATDKVLCCLDVTGAAVDKAVEENCKIIVSHHPVIFSGIKSMDNSSVLVKLIKNDISVISAHTNFDKYALGTSDRLAKFCGLCGVTEQIEYIVTVELEQENDFNSFVKSVKESTGVPLMVVKASDKVNKVFIVAGSGKDMTKEILSFGCDCVITGESSYHDMLDLKELGISTICLGHDESEKISVQTLADIIADEFKDIETVCHIEKSLVEIF